MPVSPSLIVKGNLHRNRYLPGEQLKCTVILSCVESPPSSPFNTTPVSNGRQPAVLRPYVPNSLDSTSVASTSSESPKTDASVEILSCTAQFVGVCAIDSSRMVISQEYDHQQTQPSKSGWWSSLFGGRQQQAPSISPSDLQLRIVSPSSVGRTDVTTSLSSSSLISLFDASPLGSNSDLASQGWESRFKVGESHSALLTLTLPTNVPPSLRTSLVRYVYGIHVSCSWKAPGSTVSSVTNLRIPLRIFSPVATICALQPPFESVSTGYDFNINTFTTRGDISSGTLQLPNIESPFSPRLLVGKSQKDVTPMGLLETIGDSTSVIEVGFRTRAVTQSAHDRSPVEYSSLPQSAYDGTSLLSGNSTTDYTVRCLLYQDTIAVGATLRGALLCPTLRGMLASNVPHANVEEAVRVYISLECLELAPKTCFKVGTSMVPQLTDPSTGYIVTCCTVVEERDMYISHSTECLPFEIPLTGPNIQQSVCTDIISIRWRLRVRVECAELLQVLGATQSNVKVGPQAGSQTSAARKSIPLMSPSPIITYIGCNGLPNIDDGRLVGGPSGTVAVIGVRITAPPSVQSTGPIGPYIYSS